MYGCGCVTAGVYRYGCVNAGVGMWMYERGCVKTGVSMCECEYVPNAGVIMGVRALRV